MINFLTQFLIEVPKDTRLVSWEPAFRGLSLGWLIALIVLLVLGSLGVAFVYVFEKGTIGWIRRIFLIGVRCALLLLLLTLLLRPMLLIEFEGERKLGTALLIDNSESMKQRDRRLTEKDKERVAIALNLPDDVKVPSDPPRVDLVKGVLTGSKLKLLEGLETLGPVRAFYFGLDVRGVKDDKGTDLGERIASGLKPEDSRTALADSIVKIVQSKDGDPPSAIIVMTDGQDNASKYTLLEAAEECRSLKVPLHIYGVGSSEGGQLQVKEVGGPSSTLFAEDTVSIPLRWRAQGFKKGTAEITLSLGGVPVAKKEINLQTGESLHEEIGFVVPKNAEKRETQDLVATIKYKTDGATYQDKLVRTMRVIDSKIKILFIEHSPRWEFKFLQPALTNRFKKRCDVDFLLINAAPEVANGGPPYIPEFPKTREKFFESKYNLIILGDVSPKELSKEHQEWIREFVEKRGGLIVMAGRQNMPSGYVNTPLAEVLPVEFKQEKFALDADKATQEYMPTLTEEGLRTDWLSMGDTPEESKDVWQKKLMGFYWNYPVVKLRPGATSLLVNPRLKIGEPPMQQPMPVLATQMYGKGRVVWMGTNETWRWRWNNQDKYFDRFWGQLIYQLGSPSLLGDGTERTQMALNRSQAVVGTQSTIHVTLLDKDFEPRKDPKVEAELQHMDKDGEKTPLTLYLSPGGRGQYTALIPHQRTGRFELHVKNPDVNTFSFLVDLPPDHELVEAGLAEKALRDAAQLSGGRFYREEDLPSLVSNIEPRKKEFTLRQEVLLWNPLAIVLFLGLITTEWLVRKFSDLN